MNRKYAFEIVYKVGKKKFKCNWQECDHFTLDLVEKDNTLSLSVIPKSAVTFEKFNIIIPINSSTFFSSL